MKANIKITKNDALRFILNIETMAKRRLQVGIPEDKDQRKGEGIGNAQLGYIHEFGSPAAGIPARPFLMPALQKVAPEAMKEIKTYAAQAMKQPEAIIKGLTAAGILAMSAVKNQIVSSEGMTGLSNATLNARASKGYRGTKPLIRTGQLLNSIKFVVK